MNKLNFYIIRFSLICILLTNATSHIQANEGSIKKCADGKFLIESWFCDGEKDCDDGSDEEINLCYFRFKKNECNGKVKYCANGKECIIRSWFCNGKKDCEDGSDETNCDTITKLLEKNIEVLPTMLTSTHIYTSIIFEKAKTKSYDDYETEMTSEKETNELNEIKTANETNFELKEVTIVNENNAENETVKLNIRSFNSDIIQILNDKNDVLDTAEVIEGQVTVTLKPIEISSETTKLTEDIIKVSTIQDSRFIDSNEIRSENNQSIFENPNEINETLVTLSINTDKTDNDLDQVTFSAIEKIGFSTESITKLTNKDDAVEITIDFNESSKHSLVQTGKNDSSENQVTFLSENLEVSKEAIDDTTPLERTTTNKYDISEMNKTLVNTATIENIQIKVIESVTNTNDEISMNSLEEKNQTSKINDEESKKQESLEISSSTDETDTTKNSNYIYEKTISKTESKALDNFKENDADGREHTTDNSDSNITFSIKIQDKPKAKNQELNVVKSNNFTEIESTTKSATKKPKLTNNAKPTLQKLII